MADMQSTTLPSAPEWMTTLIKIDDVECRDCVRTLERVLGRFPGIRSVDVSLESRTALIVHDPALANREWLVDLIRLVGYTPVGIPTEAAWEHHDSGVHESAARTAGESRRPRRQGRATPNCH